MDETRRWFEAGIKESDDFRAAWARARSHAIKAGFYFLKARESCHPGDWQLFLESNTSKIRPRTVRFYISLAEAALGWAKTEEPNLIGQQAEQFAISQVLLMSPRPLVALLRDLRELRPFGEYDAIRYAQRKNIIPGQIEFDFAVIDATLDSVLHLGEPNVTFRCPEGKTEFEALTELEAKFQTALDRIRAMKQTHPPTINV
jgi:hypothetical protein